MNAARRANVDERAERAYLTILAHADANGLSTQCSWTDIMDYAGIAKPDDARAMVGELIGAGLVRQEARGIKKPIFQIVDRPSKEEDAKDARAFQARNQERVNSLRNMRTNSYAHTKNGRDGAATEQIAISNLTHLPAKEKEKPDRWRFTAHIPGLGLVRNCIYIAFTHKQPEVSGPSWKTRPREDGTSEWVYSIEFEPEVRQRIYAAASEAIQQEKTAKQAR